MAYTRHSLIICCILGNLFAEHAMADPEVTRNFMAKALPKFLGAAKPFVPKFSASPISKLPATPANPETSRFATDVEAEIAQLGRDNYAMKFEMEKMSERLAQDAMMPAQKQASSDVPLGMGIVSIGAALGALLYTIATKVISSSRDATTGLLGGDQGPELQLAGAGASSRSGAVVMTATTDETSASDDATATDVATPTDASEEPAAPAEASPASETSAEPVAPAPALEAKIEEPVAPASPPAAPPAPPPPAPLPPIKTMKVGDGTLAGDAGFDPLNISDTPEKLAWQREAEIKHSRLAMLAAAGWPLSEIFNFGNLLTGDGRAPSLLNGGLGKINQVYWFAVVALAVYWEGQGLDKMFSKKDDYLPGMLGFDPLGQDSKFMRNAEITNGRVAMVAITVFALEEALIKGPIFPVNLLVGS